MCVWQITTYDVDTHTHSTHTCPHTETHRQMCAHTHALMHAHTHTHKLSHTHARSRTHTLSNTPGVQLCVVLHSIMTHCPASCLLRYCPQLYFGDKRGEHTHT